MKVRNIIVREIYINVRPVGPEGLKLVSFRDLTEINYSHLNSEITLPYVPDIRAFAGAELPYTITLDSPLRLLIRK